MVFLNNLLFNPKGYTNKGSYLTATGNLCPAKVSYPNNVEVRGKYRPTPISSYVTPLFSLLFIEKKLTSYKHVDGFDLFCSHCKDVETSFLAALYYTHICHEPRQRN